MGVSPYHLQDVSQNRCSHDGDVFPVSILMPPTLAHYISRSMLRHPVASKEKTTTTSAELPARKKIQSLQRLSLVAPSAVVVSFFACPDFISLSFPLRLIARNAWPATQIHHHHRMKKLRSTAPTRNNSGRLSIFRDDNETCVSNGLPPPPRDSPLSWPPDDVDVGAVCVDEDELDELDSVCVVICRVVARDVGCLGVVEEVDGDTVRLFVAVAVSVDCEEETGWVVEAEVVIATEELGNGVVKTMGIVVVMSAAVVLVVCDSVTSSPLHACCMRSPRCAKPRTEFLDASTSSHTSSMICSIILIPISHTSEQREPDAKSAVVQYEIGVSYAKLQVVGRIPLSSG